VNIIDKLKDLNASILIVSIFILALPFVINIHVYDMVMSIRYLSISILIFTLGLLQLKNGMVTDILKNPIVILLLLLFCVNIFSALYHNFTADAIVSLYRLFVLLSLTIFFANIFIKKDYLSIAKSILIFTLISLLIYFWQIYIAFTHEKDFISSIETISATMGNKNLLASIFFLSLPFLFYVYQSSNKLWKMLVLFVLVLILCSLILIQSKAVILGLFFMSTSIILFAFKGNSKIILSFIFIIIIIISTLFITKPKIAFQFQHEIEQVIRTKNRFLEDRIVENDSRVSLYIKTIDMIKDNPLLGVGPGNWKKEFPKYGLNNTIGEKGDKFVQRPHSDFLWFFSEGGILSGILYIFLFVLTLRDALFFYLNMKDEKRYFFLILFSTMLGYLAISLFDFPSERPTHNLFFAIILGILVSERLKKRKYYNTSNKLFGIILMFLFSINIAFANIRYKGDLHMTKALKYKSISDWGGMIAELDMAYNQSLYDIDNTTTPLMWYYGIAYFNKGQVNIAFDYFKQAYSVNPYHLHVINNLATCYGYNNDYIKAKELYEECISISSRFEEAALNLSAIYSYEKRNEEALDVLLDVHDFNLAKKSSITDIYIDYFYKIASELAEEKLHALNSQYIKKIDIFAQGNENRDFLFEQIKEISWMRKEKEMPYSKILMNLNL
jgi:O-antigen ligase